MRFLLVTALLVGGLQWATTKSRNTPLRSAPKTDAPVVVTVPKGTTLRIIGESEGPYLVVAYKGETVYVHKGWMDFATNLDGQTLQNEPQPEIRTGSSAVERRESGKGGDDAHFSDIRHFLASAQFHDPKSGRGSNTSNTLYYNDKGADFVSWIVRLMTEIERNRILPYEISWKRGHVAVRVSIDRSGDLLGTEIVVPSGVSSFDKAATHAIQRSRLRSLPAEYPDNRFEIIVVFWYNETPYDLFR